MTNETISQSMRTRVQKHAGRSMSGISLPANSARKAGHDVADIRDKAMARYHADGEFHARVHEVVRAVLNDDPEAIRYRMYVIKTAAVALYMSDREKSSTVYSRFVAHEVSLPLKYSWNTEVSGLLPEFDENKYTLLCWSDGTVTFKLRDDRGKVLIPEPAATK